MFVNMAFCQPRTEAQPSLGSYNTSALLWDPTSLAFRSPSTPKGGQEKLFLGYGEGGKKRNADGMCSVISLCRLGFLLPSVLR